jgi:hypothetical protein
VRLNGLGNIDVSVYGRKRVHDFCLDDEARHFDGHRQRRDFLAWMQFRGNRPTRWYRLAGRLVTWSRILADGQARSRYSNDCGSSNSHAGLPS